MNILYPVVAMFLLASVCAFRQAYLRIRETLVGAIRACFLLLYRHAVERLVHYRHLAAVFEAPVRYVPLALLLPVIALPALASEPAVASLGWLSGCWADENGESGSGEHWLAPAGGSMLGISRTVRGGRTVGFEFLRIGVADDGNIVLVAAPSGQQETIFGLSSLSEDSVTFENAGHDFPQRVIYRLLAGGRLVGRIEGTVNGESRHIEFPMIRAECDEHFGGTNRVGKGGTDYGPEVVHIEQRESQ
ncbi:MAG TPA: DUF6265 family protein [Woeseiaceae bacterium]|nr:DUF6265 family protein [Woeseiaceae bacterium]